MADFLYNNIAQQLEKEIQGLPEGTRLPSERDMAQKYGVSRNVLREAVRLLSEKGLLNSQPGRGIYVANDSKGKFADRLEELLLHSDSGLAEMVEVRESLEMAIVEKAVLKASDADVRDLMRLYQAMEAARDDVEGFNRVPCAAGKVHPQHDFSHFDQRLFSDHRREAVFADRAVSRAD